MEKRALVGIVGLLIMPLGMSGWAKEFKISGAEAWSLAKSNDFHFMVFGKEKVSSEAPKYNKPPFDGVQSFLGAAQIISGNCFVYKGRLEEDLYYTYFAFEDRKLAPGWKVKRVELEGNFRWQNRLEKNSRDLSFSVMMQGGKSRDARCLIRYVILEGPDDGDYRKAFVNKPRIKAGERNPPITSGPQKRQPKGSQVSVP